MARNIIDIEPWLHRALAFATGVKEIEPMVYIDCYDLNAAMSFLRGVLDGIKTITKLDDYVLTLTSNVNFRKVLNPDYKAHRKDKHKFLPHLRAKVVEEFNCCEMFGLEADDVCRILWEDDKKSVIVSVDKDMETFPCLLYNPDKYNKPTKIDKHTANENFWKQVCCGDKSDGYPGIKDFGEKSWQKIVDEGCGLNIKTIGNLFEKHKLSWEYFQLQYDMARIISSGDYKFYNDFNTATVDCFSKMVELCMEEYIC